MKVDYQGKSIIFLEDIFADATEDTPLFILAKKGQKGVIVRKSEWREKEWLVHPKGHNPFYISESEFKKYLKI